MKAKKHIYILGADSFNREELKSIAHADCYTFHSLSQYNEVKSDHFKIEPFLQKWLEPLEDAVPPPDAVVGYWDFPVSTMLPLFTERAGVTGATLESVMKCEHKYWSRREQQKCIPDYIPRFTCIDPFAEDPFRDCEIGYPFWIKPVKSVSSFLGFYIDNDADLEQALNRIRNEIDTIALPFNAIFRRADIPEAIRPIDGRHCIVEDIISKGRQCTQEGFSHKGQVEIYGTVDSIRFPGMSSFGHYEYPAIIPQTVVDRMTEISKTVINYIGYDDAPFNIEYFWDQEANTLNLLEINTRISKSHCPLFRMVDGASHHQVMVETALGQYPHFPHREGVYPYAAKFMLREFENGVVTRVPDAQTIDQLRKDIPEFQIISHVKTGQSLSELPSQDSYSYVLADIFLGGHTQLELLEKYRHVQETLQYEVGHQPVALYQHGMKET